MNDGEDDDVDEEDDADDDEEGESDDESNEGDDEDVEFDGDDIYDDEDGKEEEDQDTETLDVASAPALSTGKASAGKISATRGSAGMWDDDDDDGPASGTKASVKQQASGEERWKEGMKGKAVTSFYQRMRDSSAHDIMRRVYGAEWEKGGKGAGGVTEGDDEAFHEDSDDELFTVKGGASKREQYLQDNALDSNRAGVVDKTAFDTFPTGAMSSIE